MRGMCGLVLPCLPENVAMSIDIAGVHDFLMQLFPLLTHNIHLITSIDAPSILEKSMN